MNESNTELIILRAGYDTAINDILNIIDKNTYIDAENKDVLKQQILRKQLQHKIGNTQYEGYLFKYYDTENNLGYIIFEDIFEIKGVCIFIEEGKYINLDEKEILYVKNNFEIKYFESFINKDLINLRYEEWLNKFEEK